MQALVNALIFIEESKPMHAMEPLEVGVVDDPRHRPDHNQSNPVVMRTASLDKREVMDLSRPRPLRSWSGEASGRFSNLTVRPLTPQEKIDFLGPLSSMPDKLSDTTSSPTLLTD